MAAGVSLSPVFKWLLIAIAALIAVVVGSWWHTRYRAEAALLERPAFRVIRQHAPGVFVDLRDEYLLYQRDEESRDRFENFAHEAVGIAATRALPRAAQDSVLALLRDMVATATKLQSAPDQACFRFWFPEVAGGPDLASNIDAATRERTLDLMAEVIRSAAETPQPPPNPDAIKDNLAGIVDGTYQLFGADAQMLANASDPRADRAKVCAITNSIYERILQLPPATASDLLRAMAPG
jgi:hypothetical protein